MNTIPKTPTITVLNVSTAFTNAETVSDEKAIINEGIDIVPTIARSLLLLIFKGSINLIASKQISVEDFFANKFVTFSILTCFFRVDHHTFTKFFLSHFFINGRILDRFLLNIS